jgi:hypothetical protein
MGEQHEQYERVSVRMHQAIVLVLLRGTHNRNKQSAPATEAGAVPSLVAL